MPEGSSHLVLYPMNKPIVLLDCDGPLADFTSAFLKEMHTILHQAGSQEVFTPDDVDQWHIHECSFFKEAAERAGLHPDSLKRSIYKQIVEPDFCSEIKPQPWAADAVERLQSLAEVYVVTSPWDSSPTWMHERTNWVRTHLGLPKKNVIHAAQKHLVFGHVFVDDKLSHCEEWGRQWYGTGTAVLFDMHHNKTPGTDIYPVRRGRWEMVLQLVDDRLG